MFKQMPLLILTTTFLILFSFRHIQSAAEIPFINVKACNKLWQAAYWGNLKAAKQALAEGAHIDMGAEYGNIMLSVYNLPLSTPLRAAAINAHLSLVTFLLEEGAHPDAVIPANSPTLLIEMCMCTHIPHKIIQKIITKLLAHNAYVNARHPIFKSTPLWWATHTLQDENIAQQLILAGAKINVRDKNGKTVLNMVKTYNMISAIDDARVLSIRIRQAHVLPDETKTPEETPPTAIERTNIKTKKENKDIVREHTMMAKKLKKEKQKQQQSLQKS